ncbi:MAG TPA: sulfur carrier protein ThiS [Syntrophales bacterium]|jgi:sulfur carrier protein|nr:sulfur carrier protein ThiS [Syntrophales bacterium]HQA83495.1 sulfur carrier protein ThiS [Syntrophales bacterium]
MIKLNGTETPYRETIGELLSENHYEMKKIAVLVNGEIVKRENWPVFVLKPGDEVDVVTFVGGG